MTPLEDYFRLLFPYQYDKKLRFLLNQFSIIDITSEITEWLLRADLDRNEVIRFAENFCYSSDLSVEEKKAFFDGLTAGGFFLQISRFLYQTSFSQCIWAIDNLGKFNMPFVIDILEVVYRKCYMLKNPLIAAHCLDKLIQLNPEKIREYMDELTVANTLIAKVILLYYSVTGHMRFYSFKHLMNDDEILSLVFPLRWQGMSTEQLFSRLEQYRLYLIEREDSAHLIAGEVSDSIKTIRKYFIYFDTE